MPKGAADAATQEEAWDALLNASNDDEDAAEHVAILKSAEYNYVSLQTFIFGLLALLAVIPSSYLFYTVFGFVPKGEDFYLDLHFWYYVAAIAGNTYVLVVAYIALFKDAKV